MDLDVLAAEFRAFKQRAEPLLQDWEAHKAREAELEADREKAYQAESPAPGSVQGDTMIGGEGSAPKEGQPDQNPPEAQGSSEQPADAGAGAGAGGGEAPPAAQS